MAAFARLFFLGCLGSLAEQLGGPELQAQLDNRTFGQLRPQLRAKCPPELLETRPPLHPAELSGWMATLKVPEPAQAPVWTCILGYQELLQQARELLSPASQGISLDQLVQLWDRVAVVAGDTVFTAALFRQLVLVVVSLRH